VVVAGIIRRECCIGIDWRWITLVMCEGERIEGREILEGRAAKETSEVVTASYGIIRVYCSTKTRTAATLDVKESNAERCNCNENQT
jgi:hypothetical protein